MKRRGIHTGLIFAVAAALLLSVTGCREEKHMPDRYDDVLIVFQAGYYPGSNDLGYYMTANNDDLRKGFLPGKYGHKAVVMVSRMTSYYASSSSPYVCHLYYNGSKAVADTLKAFPEDMNLAVKGNMRKVLEYVASQFPSDRYGMIYSSHGSGWLPEGYYFEPSRYDADYREDGSIFFWNRRPGTVGSEGRRYPARDFSGGYVSSGWKPEGPAVKSLGVESESVGGKTVAHEINITDFPAEIPFHLDYLILDACLMGGVETAYEFRHVTDHLLFSQAEIMADGVGYKNIVSRLFEGKEPDLEGVVQDYFDNYDAQSGASRSATFSMVDCRALDGLAEVCSGIFEKYRSQIAAVKGSSVQGFFRYSRHFYYDLEDILVKAGVGEDDMADFRDALSLSVRSVVATEWMLRGSGGFEVKTDCGLSMYLPSMGTAFTDAWYRELSWNKATSLVQ